MLLLLLLLKEMVAVEVGRRWPVVLPMTQIVRVHDDGGGGGDQRRQRRPEWQRRRNGSAEARARLRRGRRHGVDVDEILRSDGGHRAAPCRF